MNILSNPTTVKLLAAQLILACDAYISKRFSEKQLKELVLHYATYHGTKLFSANGINPTVINRLGKKRLELVNIMLQGFQYKL
ncbi:MAG: TIGR04540 family protein [Clostridia bacterium]|nr:TIGR04540 family protein [Clostridia bacterium]